jgi:uncharacterized membrane protein
MFILTIFGKGTKHVFIILCMYELGFIYWLQLTMMHIKLRQNIRYTHINYHRRHPTTSTSMFFLVFLVKLVYCDHVQGDITKIGKRLEGEKEKK